MLENLLHSALTFFGETREIDTIIFGTLKDDCHGTIIFKVIVIVINLILAGTLVAGTISIVLSGIQILSAADNASQLVRAKKRIIDTLVGVAAYGLMYVLLALFVPGGVSLDIVYDPNKTCPEHTIVGPIPVTHDPVDPTDPTDPTDPDDPPAGGGGCKGNTVSKDGFCYAKTKVMAYDYVKNACSTYHSCQSYKSEWSSSCAMVAAMNGGEMINGFKSPHETIVSTAPYTTFNIDSQEGEDNVSNLMCDGSLSRPTTKPGAPSINRIAFKRFVKKMVEEIEKGKPVVIAAGAKRRGVWSTANHRHFVTIVAISSALNSSNVDSIKVEFESGNCINSGKSGKPEPWDQPIVTIGGTRVKFRYVDPWGATLGTFDENKARLWRFHYQSGGWYGYQYK